MTQKVAIVDGVRWLPVFYDSDMPNGATHCKQADCGFSLYRGVLVQWDEDQDPRVLNVLDHMRVDILERLLIVQEHEGGISFVWKGPVPEGWDVSSMGGGVDPGDGDNWSVMASYSIDMPTGKDRR